MFLNICFFLIFADRAGTIINFFLYVLLLLSCSSLFIITSDIAGVKQHLAMFFIINAIRIKC